MGHVRQRTNILSSVMCLLTKDNKGKCKNVSDFDESQHVTARRPGQDISKNAASCSVFPVCFSQQLQKLVRRRKTEEPEAKISAIYHLDLPFSSALLRIGCVHLWLRIQSGKPHDWHWAEVGRLRSSRTSHSIDKPLFFSYWAVKP